MAQVSDAVHQEIERLLERLTERWQHLPEVAAEIDRWDLIDQLNFTEEWPLEEDRLADLECYAAQGILQPDQLARYQALKELIARNQPLLRRIMET
ncbi:MAG: hypothetical protein HY690_08340 [Chloroflexi bacterium]|nr:hypothetical protein [Chloroflexota bacterium]